MSISRAPVYVVVYFSATAGRVLEIRRFRLRFAASIFAALYPSSWIEVIEC